MTMDAKRTVKQLEIGKVYFVHCRTRAHGAVTLAARCDGRGPDGACAFTVAAAFCAPTDRWSAALGQTIAGGRLAAGRTLERVVVEPEQIDPQRPIATALRIVRRQVVDSCWIEGERADRARVPRWIWTWCAAWALEGAR